MLKHSLVPLLLGALLSSGCAETAHPAPGQCDALPTTMKERIDPFVTESMRTGHIPGLSLVVLQGGQPVCIKSYGLANVEKNQPMTPNTLVSIGSTTKAMTALALMQQVEAGAVALDAPVTRYLPWFRTADGLQDQILVKHLLSHTSGLPNGMAWDGDHDDEALERMVRSLAEVKLHFPPGQQEAYSNDGLAVAGLIVQTVARKPFEQHMADSVFEPLGMSRTFMGAVPEQEQDVVQGYTWTRGQLHTMAPPWSRAHVPAGSATHTTAEDVSRYFSALLARGEATGGRVLSAQGIERMWQPAVMTHNGPSANGLGWVISEESGRKRVSHGGNTITSSSSFNLIPSEGLAVGVLSNLNTPVTELVGTGVVALLSGEEPTKPVSNDRAPSTFVPDTSVWRNYVGTYDTAIGPLIVSVEAGHLWLTIEAARPPVRGELEAYGDNDFVERDELGLLEGMSVKFKPSPDGGMLLLLNDQPVGGRVP
ncbi:serine hydrolase [Cystobacter fuscus]|uniref:serine hydrolase domain-containing protein n=1 Tax=Cystobacter fuscus TaxID=43 RepID=UPI002B2A1AAD|nr:serine hydrolase [Cystobacter fuscus]